MPSDVLELARQLIARPSITPDDAGCQPLIARWLADFGFLAEHVRFGDVDNLWLRRGDAAPLLVFAGHTDVVPPGPLDQWHSDPFEPSVRDGQLFGRGAADMKGAIAAWVVACRAFIADHPDHRGSVALLITSDEEGPCRDGTRRMMPWLAERGEHIDWCVVGEASSEKRLADVVKNGRRGSHGAQLRVFGRQSHIAYALPEDNPNHGLVRALADICAIQWDRGNRHFPPTALQVSELRSGTGAENVVPGVAEARFNLRYSTETDAAEIERRVREVLDRHGLRYEIQWHGRGEPFLTPEGTLTEAVSEAVDRETGRRPRLSTGGGTSDGRFIAPAGAQVVELGPINASIHRVDEHAAVADLQRLSVIYRHILELLLL